MKAVLLILLGVLIALGTLMEVMFTLAFIGVCVNDLKHDEHDISSGVVGAIICTWTTLMLVYAGWLWVEMAWPVVRAGLGG